MSPLPKVNFYIDGASRGNPGPAGVGVVQVSDDGEVLFELSRYIGETTNNVAEYLALIYALQHAALQRYEEILVRTDSQLMARQFDGQYQVKNSELIRLHGLVKHLADGFKECRVEHVPREQNKHADKLAGQAVTRRSLG